MKLYSIKDTKNKFMKPFEEVNDDCAIRTCKTLANDDRTMIGMFPEDYELWRIGNFNEENAELTSDLEFICRAIDHKKGV